MWNGIDYIHLFQLNDNSLEWISFDCFGPNLDIYNLYLERNRIRHLDRLSFNATLSLQEVHLRGNLLNHVPCFSDHPPKRVDREYAGVVLYLYDNPLHSQPPSCWIGEEDLSKGYNKDIKCLNQICDKSLHLLISSHFVWGKTYCCRMIDTETTEIPETTDPSEVTTQEIHVNQYTSEMIITDKMVDIERYGKSKTTGIITQGNNLYTTEVGSVTQKGS